MGGASYLQFLIVFWMVMQVDWAKGVAFVRDLWVEWFHRFLTFWLTVWLLMLAFIWWTRNNTCPLVNGNVLSFRQVLSQCWDMDIGLSCLFLVKYPLGICVFVCYMTKFRLCFVFYVQSHASLRHFYIAIWNVWTIGFLSSLGIASITKHQRIIAGLLHHLLKLNIVYDVSNLEKAKWFFFFFNSTIATLFASIKWKNTS